MGESPIRPPAHKAGKRISIALAVAVHLLLAAFLFYGVRWQTKATDVVEVELVRAAPEPAAAPPVAVAPAPTIEPPPPPEPKPEPKPAPKPAPPPPKPQIALKDKSKPPPKVETKVETKPAVDPFQEQLKQELTQRKNLDSATQEFARKQATQAFAARDKAIADYLGRIRGKVRGNIVLPPQIKGNPEAVFDVTQLPSGEILTVRLKRSSGYAALDAAIERAILKSNPLPKPQQADVFERELELRFRPLDD